MIIGILLNNRLYKDMINNGDTFENLSFYEHFSYENQVAICFYCMRGASHDKSTLSGYIIDPFDGTTSLKKVPWPKYHYCRAVLNRAGKKKMDKMISANPLYFYQLQSGQERNKLKHLFLLRLNPVLAEHLPDSMPFNPENLLLLLQKYEQIVIKPIAGSLGRKIALIEKRSDFYLVKSKDFFSTGSQIFTLEEMLHFFEIIYQHPQKYMLQEKVRSDTYLDRVYECRVSVQKNETGQWEVTGKAIRLAQPGEFLTNIHQGADALTFDSLFKKNKHVSKELNSLSILIAEQLAKHFKVIDLGLDLKLDQNHKVWFIESNLRDQRLTYRAADDYQTWYRTTVTPLFYILSEMAKEQPNHINE